MSNNQPHRQKCQPKLYTEADMNRISRKVAQEIAKQNVLITVSSFSLTLHRKLGLDSAQIGDILAAMNELCDSALCFSEIREQLKEEVGLDIVEYVGEMA